MTGTHSDKLINKVKRIIDRQLGKDYQWPGNVRELEQCVRSVLLRRDYKGKSIGTDDNLGLKDGLIEGLKQQSITVPDLVSGNRSLEAVDMLLAAVEKDLEHLFGGNVGPHQGKMSALFQVLIAEP